MFARIIWAVQLVVGIGLICTSAIFEWKVFGQFISIHSIALPLAIILEMGKAVAVVWHRYLLILNKQFYAWPTRVASVLFRTCLFTLSLLCSELFLANQLDRPNLTNIRNNDLVRLEVEISDTRTAMKADYLNHINRTKSEHKAELEELRARRDNQIQRYQNLLTEEMSNVVNGTYKGPRYADFTTKLAQVKSESQSALEKTKHSYVAQIQAVEKLYKTGQENIQLDYTTRYREIYLDDYSNDDRVHDPYVVSFLQLIESLSSYTAKPLQFVFYFSLLLSVIIELGIYLSFENITLALARSLKINQRADEIDDVEMVRSRTKMNDLHRENEDSVKAVNERAKEAINTLLNTKRRIDSALS